MSVIASVPPSAWRSWGEAGLSFVYPALCQICEQQRAAPELGYVCTACQGQVKRIRPPYCDRCGLPFAGEMTTPFECANCQEMELYFVHARSAVAAKGVAMEVIHRYKYQRELWFEPFLAGLLISAAAAALREESWDLITPVPLHRLKQAEREFNQAERLAVCLSRATAIPLAARLLRRVLPTRTQTQLSRRERAANVRRAFAFTGHGEVKGRRVVLVDDVLTTGATTSACAQALLEAGARQVCVWTVARGLLH